MSGEQKPASIAERLNALRNSGIHDTPPALSSSSSSNKSSPPAKYPPVPPAGALSAGYRNSMQFGGGGGPKAPSWTTQLAQQIQGSAQRNAAPFPAPPSSASSPTRSSSSSLSGKKEDVEGKPLSENASSSSADSASNKFSASFLKDVSRRATNFFKQAVSPNGTVLNPFLGGSAPSQSSPSKSSSIPISSSLSSASSKSPSDPPISSSTPSENSGLSSSSRIPRSSSSQSVNSESSISSSMDSEFTDKRLSMASDFDFESLNKELAAASNGGELDELPSSQDGPRRGTVIRAAAPAPSVSSADSQPKAPAKPPPTLKIPTQEELIEKYASPSDEVLKAVDILQRGERRRKACKVFAKMRKQDYNRFRSAAEILSTEVSYVENVRVLVAEYLRPMQQASSSPKPLIRPDDVSSVFSDIEVILGFNQAFLQHMHELMGEKASKYHRTSTKLSLAFLRMAPYFKAYSRYCNNFERSLEVLSRCKEKDEFETFLNSLDDAPAARHLGINSFLIMPIQRIPRYALLLQELIKNTVPQHPDYKGLVEALGKIKAIADHLDSSVKHAESTMKMNLIAQNLTGIEPRRVNLVLPHRRFLKEGIVQRVRYEDDQQKTISLKDRTFFLFNDMILLCRRRDALGRDAYIYRGRIYLTGAQLQDLPDSGQLSNALQIDGDRDMVTADNGVISSIILALPDAAAKSELLSEIKSAMEAWHQRMATMDASSSNQQGSNKKAALKEDSLVLQTVLGDSGNKGSSEDQVIDPEEALTAMWKGATLLKHGRTGKPHFRRFVLSKEGTHLSWGSPNKSGTESTVYLIEVHTLCLGQETPVFQRSAKDELKKVSFSLLYKDRSLDIVCKDRVEMLTWTTGLRFLMDRARAGLPPIPPEMESSANAVAASFSSPSSSSFSSSSSSSSLSSSFSSSYSYSPLSSAARPSGDFSSSSFSSSLSSSSPLSSANRLSNRDSVQFSASDASESQSTYDSDSRRNSVVRASIGSVSELDSSFQEQQLQSESSPATPNNSSKVTTTKKAFEDSYAEKGDAYTWGQGDRGALGNGEPTEDSLLPAVVKDFLFVDTAFMACGPSCCASVTASGELFTFGANEKGRLGHGDTTDRQRPSLVKAMSGKRVVQVAIGMHHMMILTDAGEVYSVGGNAHGQLGLGDKEDRYVPTRIDHLSLTIGRKVTFVACGPWHSAAITENGQLYTWGRGDDWQLGHSTAASLAAAASAASGSASAPVSAPDSVTLPEPVRQLNGHRITSVACGLWHTICLSETGKVFSWGGNTYGQCGSGAFSLNLEGISPESSAPIQVPTALDQGLLKGKLIVQIAAGNSHSACLTKAGDVLTWGCGIYGQLGDEKGENRNTPVQVKGVKAHLFVAGPSSSVSSHRSMSLACGTNHTIVLCENSKVYSFGSGTYGRLGLGNESDQKKPHLIDFLKSRGVRAIAAGGSQSACICAHAWVPDDDTPNCMQCRAEFTFIRRRHHCRNCGRVLCGACSSKKAIILKYGFDEPVRVCDSCHTILKEGR